MRSAVYLSKYLEAADTTSNLMHEWALKLFYGTGWLIKLSVKNGKDSILISWIYIMVNFTLNKNRKAHPFSYYLPSEFWHS